MNGKMKSIKWFCVIICLLSSFMATGCWDKLEIEDRGTILGLAIDPLYDRTPSITGPQARGTGYRITAQVAIPGRIPLGPAESGGSGGSQNPVWVVSARGKTVDGAMNNLQQELADKLFLGHLRVIIINQKLARSTGIGRIQDYFRRNPEVRRLTWLAISKGEAETVIKAAPKLERVPTLYLVGMMEHAVQLGKLPNVFLGNFWSTLSAKGEEPVLPLLKVEGKNRERVQSEGLAVFRQYRMVGTLDPLETAAWMEIKNERRAGYAIAVRIPHAPADHTVMVKGYRRRATIKIHMAHGKPAFELYSYIEANILERNGPEDLAGLLDELSTASAKQLQKQQEKLIANLQRMRADCLGLGEYIRGEEPGYWQKQLRSSRVRWEAQFAKTPIHPHVIVVIRRYGMSAH